jgi:hypothetical protein
MSYITFKTIGESGNLGSQVQQYASLYAVAKETNREIIFPESSLSQGYGFKFAELLNIPITVAPDDFFQNFINIRPDDSKIVDETLIPRMNPSLNYNIENRFDLFHYWYPKYSQDILNWEWNQNHLSIAKQIYSNIRVEGKEMVAIHVRRGDYLLPQHDHFCKLDTDYYSEALQYYISDIEKYHFVVFSNDIEWCKENLIEGEMVTFIEPGLDYVDLILMSLCDHIIAANSSYSWWSSFKNQNTNKRITCPVNYLKSYGPWTHINNNYYPSEWVSINNTNI